MKENIEKGSPNKPPPELEDFLDLSGLIIPNQLPDADRMLFGFTEKFIAEENPDDYSNNPKSFEFVMREKAKIKTWEHITKMSKIFKFEYIIELVTEHLGMLEPPPLDYFEYFDEKRDKISVLLSRFIYFTNRYEILRLVAKSQTTISKGDFFSEDPEFLLIYDDQDKVIQANYVLPFTVPTRYIITKEGYFAPADPLIAALCKVEINRLRICPICDHLYWAYRMNQKYCSRKCSNVFHQRKHLSDPKNREQIKEKRKANYEYKKPVEREVK